MLESRLCHLDLVTPAVYPELYQLLVGGDGSYRWRFRGVTPDPRGFEASLWEGNLAQFVLTGPKSRSIAGLVSAYGFDGPAGIVQVGVFLAEPYRRATWPLFGVGYFLNYLFDHWPIRKIYSHIPGYNVDAVRIARRAGFETEGVLVDYVYGLGTFWDEHVLALERSAWEQSRLQRYLARAASQ